MSWEQNLTPEERREWERWVKHVREDVVQKMVQSGAVISLVPDGEPDIKFAVELGLSIMLDKPIVALAMAGSHVPEKLKRVADQIIQLEGDLDTEAGQQEAHAKLKPFLESLK